MLHFATRTDVGRVRDHNEDCFASHVDLGLWVLADGMGGHASGEVASEIVCTSIASHVRGGATLSDAVQRAHRDVLAAVKDGRGGQGMGSTVVALRMEQNNFEIAWVGDSRAYLWDGTQLQQLSRDHSFVQHLLDAGTITEQEAREHPNRNVILQSMGSPQLADVKVDVIRGRLLDGHCILMCSDGLNSELTNEEIAQVLLNNPLPTNAVAPLIAAANANGGHDNITVIIVAELSDSQALQERTTAPLNASEVARAADQHFANKS